MVYLSWANVSNTLFCLMEPINLIVPPPFLHCQKCLLLPVRDACCLSWSVQGDIWAEAGVVFLGWVHWFLLGLISSVQHGWRQESFILSTTCNFNCFSVKCGPIISYKVIHYFNWTIYFGVNVMGLMWKNWHVIVALTSHYPITFCEIFSKLKILCYPLNIWNVES